MGTHALSSQIPFILMFWGFFWCMAILVRDFGIQVIPIFFTGIGSIIIALMAIINIRKTWKPMLLMFFGLGSYYVLYSLGL